MHWVHYLYLHRTLCSNSRTARYAQCAPCRAQHFFQQYQAMRAAHFQWHHISWLRRDIQRLQLHQLLLSAISASTAVAGSALVAAAVAAVACSRVDGWCAAVGAQAAVVEACGVCCCGCKGLQDEAGQGGLGVWWRCVEPCSTRQQSQPALVVTSA